jgi:hypothetical protein
MSKEKEMLRVILANTNSIMEHLKTILDFTQDLRELNFSFRNSPIIPLQKDAFRFKTKKS